MINPKLPAIPIYLIEKVPVDLSHLQFIYIPQFLKYYASQGWNFVSQSKNLNYLMDYKIAVGVSQNLSPEAKKYHKQQWDSLVYYWALSPEYDLSSFYNYINKISNESWIDRGNVMNHLADFLQSESKANELNLAVKFISNSTNGIVGFDYIEKFGTNLNNQKFGSDHPREKVLEYVSFLITKFKAYAQIKEDYYDPELTVKDIINIYKNNQDSSF